MLPLKSVEKVVLQKNDFLHRSVNSFFICVMIKQKLTSLRGDCLLRLIIKDQ